MITNIHYNLSGQPHVPSEINEIRTQCARALERRNSICLTQQLHTIWFGVCPAHKCRRVACACIQLDDGSVIGATTATRKRAPHFNWRITSTVYHSRNQQVQQHSEGANSTATTTRKAAAVHDHRRDIGGVVGRSLSGPRYFLCCGILVHGL